MIFVPGLGGSILHNKWAYSAASLARLKKEVGDLAYYGVCDRKQDWEQLWVSPQGGMTDLIGGAACWRYRMTPDYQKGVGFVNRPDIQAEAWIVPPLDANGNLVISDYFGGTDAVDVLISIAGYTPSTAYMFHLLLQDMKSKGYRSKESVFGAPYDFRRITSKYYSDYYFSALKKLIEHSVAVNNNQPCILIAHSLGCCVTKRFLSEFLPTVMGGDGPAQLWKNRYVDTWVPIGSPIGGAGKGLRTAISGDDEGLGAICKLTGGCNYWYQKLERDLSGLIWILPDSYLYSGVDFLPGSGYDVNKIEDLKALTALVDAKDVGVAFEEEVVPMRNFMYSPPGVKTHAICGSKTPTELAYHYQNFGPNNKDPLQIFTEDKIYPTMKNPSWIQKKIMEGVNPQNMIGDATVPWLALHLPKIWMANSPLQNLDVVSKKYIDVQIKDFTGPLMDHKEMLDVPEVRNYILSIMLA